MTKVSTILTVYNLEVCLRETLDSVVNQTYTDMEIICVDDGSTDESRAILRSYAARDARIHLIFQQNAGPAAARNAGLDAASGEYVLLLDGDDIYEPVMVEHLVERAEAVNADIVVSRCEQFEHATGKRSDIVWTAKIEQIPQNDPFCALDMADYIFTAFIGWPWDKLYRRAFIEENHLRFPLLKNSEDLYFVFLALFLAQRISLVDEVLIYHRIKRSTSVSMTRIQNSDDFYKAICLLKQELQRMPERYHAVEWGFLNWAMDYTLWNIQTLPHGRERKEIISRLVNGELAELELDKHGVNYFSLSTKNEYNYKVLAAELHEAADKKGHKVDVGYMHPRLSYVVEFFETAQQEGWKVAFGRFAEWFGRRAKGAEDKYAVLARKRGTNFWRNL